jgi:GNAT superfamily N-acetyltransferase
MIDLRDIEITTDKERVDVEFVHTFLVDESYWARDRSIEQTRTAIDNSICFSVFLDGRQVAFARVVSDKATFAYLGDVFVDADYRSSGIGKLLMKTIVQHPEVQGLRRWLLATRDAHGLYERYGFSSLRFPDRWMEKTAPNAY